MIRHVPLLVVAVALYALTALLGLAAPGSVFLGIGLVSGATLTLSVAELIVLLGLVLLFLEILKSTRTASASAIDHALSMALFALCLVLFLSVPAFGTGTFFLLLAMTAIDVVAGFTVTINAARRDVGFDPRNEL